MRRLTVATLVVVVAAVPAVVMGATNASVTDVQIAPNGPAPGETITFTPTIRNLQSSGDSLYVRAVALRAASGGGGVTEYTRVRQIGTISPGTELQIPLTHVFETAGTRDLRVVVYGENTNTGNNVELRYPVSVAVQQRHPQIDIRPNDSVAGVPADGAVTIANGLDTDLSNVDVTVSGDGVTMLDDRTVLATVERGETIDASFRFRPESAGEHELEATVSYTLPDGTERSVTRNRTVQTETLREGVILETSGVGSGQDRSLAVDVINQGNAPAEDVVVTATSENATFGRALVSSVAAGATQRVQLDATLAESSADVTVTADYEVGSAQRAVNTTTTLQSVPGAISLTGLDVRRDDGVYQITGSASNIGTTATQSVVVSVVQTSRVDPAPPNRDFFVGEVPPSDFSSFDLTARTTQNVSEIPVEVTYLVDGTRKRQRFDVAVGSVDSAPQPSANSGGGPGTGLIAVVGIAIVALLVVAGVLVRRYRRDNDDL